MQAKVIGMAVLLACALLITALAAQAQQYTSKVAIRFVETIEIRDPQTPLSDGADEADEADEIDPDISGAEGADVDPAGREPDGVTPAPLPGSAYHKPSGQ